MIIIPEVVLYDFVKDGLELIKNDYLTNSNSSWLRSCLVSKEGKPIVLESMNFYEQAIEMFVKNNGATRKLELNLGYNLQRSQLPTIHIIMPAESPMSSGIGRNEGYIPPVVDEINHKSYNVANANYNVTYNLLITSNNSGEVTIIYHILKSMFLALQPLLEFKRLFISKFGGSDLSFQDDMIPVEIFHRNFNVTFEYENNVRDFSSTHIANDFVIGEASVQL